MAIVIFSREVALGIVFDMPFAERPSVEHTVRALSACPDFDDALADARTLLAGAFPSLFSDDVLTSDLILLGERLGATDENTSIREWLQNLPWPEYFEVVV